ncbi:hypothetical protein RIF29_08939 [Crotalaria pallida]|uniref:Uncharacterized protein n=1 Tax=Crotalaria pallida TaxID=3830 RepID=A0AAN9IJG0_CROPI
MMKQMQLRISADGIFGSSMVQSGNCKGSYEIISHIKGGIQAIEPGDGKLSHDHERTSMNMRLLEETKDKNRRKSFCCVLSRASKGLLISFEVLDFFRAKGASKDPTRVITKVA